MKKDIRVLKLKTKIRNLENHIERETQCNNVYAISGHMEKDYARLDALEKELNKHECV